MRFCVSRTHYNPALLTDVHVIWYHATHDELSHFHSAHPELTLPLHFHRLRLKRSGLLGLLAAFLCFLSWAYDLAQYASPLGEFGRTLGPPPFALPACPYETVLVRPVFGLRTVFDLAFPLAGAIRLSFS